MTCTCNSSCTCSDTEIKQIVADAVSEQSEKFTELTQQSEQSATAADNSAHEAAISASQAASSANVSSSNANAASESAKQSANSASAAAISATSAIQVTSSLQNTADSLADTASKLTTKVDTANASAESAESAKEAAAVSETNARQSAGAAEGSAMSAANSASQAVTASNTALGYMTSSQDAANTASLAKQSVVDNVSAFEKNYQTLSDTLNTSVSAAQTAQVAAEASANNAANSASAASTSALAATNNAATAKDAATQTLSYLSAAQNGIATYADYATLAATTPTSDQVAVTTDTSNMYYWTVNSGVWTDLGVTLNNWVMDIKNIHIALDSATEKTFVDTNGATRKTWKFIEDYFATLDGSSMGILAFATKADMDAKTPTNGNALALVTATGDYYYWSGTAWTLSTYQPKSLADTTANQVQANFLALQAMLLTLQNFATAFNASMASVSDVVTQATATEKRLQNVYLAQQATIAAVNAINSSLPTEDQKLAQFYAMSRFMTELSPLNGFNTKATNKVNPSTENGNTVYSLGAPKGIVKIFITSPSGVPATKDVDLFDASVEINVDGQIVSTSCQLSVQGATSANRPKKNLNMDFYTDSTMETEAQVKLGPIIPHETLIFKANWLDCTQVRNALGYNFWDVIVESRKGLWPKREIDFSYIGKSGTDAIDTGAMGHPTGWPCVTYINGEFYGVGDLMTGKKRSNYNMKKKDQTKVLIGWDLAVDIAALPASEEAVTWEIRNPSKPDDSTYAVIQGWRDFAGQAQEDFTASFDTHLDAQNCMDIYLMYQFLGAYDCVNKNTIMGTYDGVKWFFFPYDLDSTFGLRWDGSSIIQTPQTNVMSGNAFWKKVASALGNKLEERYAQLRSSGVFSLDTIIKLSQDRVTRFNKDLLEAEQAKWQEPSWDVTNLDQIYTWIKDHIVYLDSLHNYTPN